MISNTGDAQFSPWHRNQLDRALDVEPTLLAMDDIDLIEDLVTAVNKARLNDQEVYVYEEHPSGDAVRNFMSPHLGKLAVLVGD